MDLVEQVHIFDLTNIHSFGPNINYAISSNVELCKTPNDYRTVYHHRGKWELDISHVFVPTLKSRRKMGKKGFTLQVVTINISRCHHWTSVFQIIPVIIFTTNLTQVVHFTIYICSHLINHTVW